MWSIFVWQGKAGPIPLSLPALPTGRQAQRDPDHALRASGLTAPKENASPLAGGAISFWKG